MERQLKIGKCVSSKGLTGAIFGCAATKGLTGVNFVSVAAKGVTGLFRLRERLLDAGRRTGSVEPNTEERYHSSRTESFLGSSEPMSDLAI